MKQTFAQTTFAQSIAQSVAQYVKPLLKGVLIVGLIFSLVFGQAHDAMAASRSGGRMGGGSFRAPARSYSSPRPSGGAYGGGYGGGYNRGYGGGGGFFFFPSPWMFIGGGGGSLFMLLVLAAIGTYLFQTYRQAAEGGSSTSSPNVSVAKVQVGLLAEAKELKTELNQLALKANTNDRAGLAKLLQETTLAVLRHPEYWVYGGSETKQARLESAEAEFNRMILMERSKVSGETLSNVAGELKQKGEGGGAITVARAEALANSDPGEYIVVTLVVGTDGPLALPTINGESDLRTALNVLGAVGRDRLMAVEVLWTPQAEGDVLTRDEMIADYPSLKLV